MSTKGNINTGVNDKMDKIEQRILNVLMKMNDSINFHENELKAIKLERIEIQKVLSDYKKKNKKKNDGQRKTALTMPVNITKEFAEFLDKDEKCQMSRIEGAKYIREYIDKNHLKNKRVFYPDETLRELMNVPDDINEIAIVGALQKYTKHLFVNP